MKMLLAGGGTGGHLFPAVAIAQQLLRTDPDAETLFVGTERGIEARVLPQLGLALKTIDIAGFVGRSLAAKLALAPKLLRSLRQSLKIIDQFRPDVVVGVGGYASGPVLLAAKRRGCPILIHEQNAAPGLTNRLLGRLAGRICLTFDESAAFFRGNTVLTGNPVRSTMADCPPLPESPPTLLVFGGSRGARAINQAMVGALPHLESWRGRLKIIHQTGDEDLETVQGAYREAGWKDAEIRAFIDDMADVYARSQLVVCRAGATTIAELTACGRPAVLIPYPHAAGDHQNANARSLAKKGAALLLPQTQLDGKRLATLVADLLDDRRRLLEMAGAARSLGRPEAAELILDQCRAMARKG
ncbi:undecaprenyldiphospho-muramoylpentapeptide beta-N-acetylglucosaminyltransferase [Geothermobacter hydrogeniphilus]|uniref:UDP-N-acetylglucosamine--N-acetylmuramyl-(pentapeptide) pyrophosphoryl-undecaprenol N-acetylglucosamine transferase n=1 Tax=Geothermobacter hydrogeniphilus TaxID=1969733 RepID=A0A1X0YBH2_9BACT|nr:undecaprenyldiphospho-muramoylpentapeptide beta-N-acetylglucosaminyltransferase [Geothermobacter hydrogeniphilus]ORJ62467.1 undecaprenyldiphospho-muramoylpentapeptide beta-N-acetylglucosaminyltransferase [Geothermobacter hydrogeniphilus]